MRQRLRDEPVGCRVERARACERDVGQRAGEQRDELLEASEGGEGRSSGEALLHDRLGKRALGKQPVEDRVSEREVDVGVDDRREAPLLLVRAHERGDEAPPADPRHFEEERVEGSPVVVDEAGRLAELTRDPARRELGPLERRACLEQIADRGGGSGR